MENLVNLELAKRLKEEGYCKKCEYFYQDKDLSYSKKGLKKTKNGEKLNHNKYDDFIYSAPTLKEAVDFLIGKNIDYNSYLVLNLNNN